MDFLNMLLQSLGGAGGDEEEDFDPNAPIDVMGARGRAQSDEPIYGDPQERPVTRQKYILNDDRMAPTEKELKEIIPRSNGYFGTKGTLRNILGGLSDAFLVQGGGDFEYKKLRDREKQGDAMFGFSDNPQQAMERLAAGGYGKEAADLQQNVATQEQNRANLASQEQGRQSLAKDRQWGNLKEGRNQVARWFGAANTPEKMAVAQRYAAALADQLGVTVEELGNPTNEDERGVLSAGDMTVNQQQNLPIAQQRADASTMNAGSSRINAERPRPGRAPAQPRAKNDEERLEAAYSTPPAQRTEYQRNLIERKNKTGSGSGRSSNRRPVAPPTPRPGWGISVRN